MNRLTIDEAKTRLVDGLSDIFEVDLMAGDYDNRLDIRLQLHGTDSATTHELRSQRFTNETLLQEFIDQMRENAKHLG